MEIKHSHLTPLNPAVGIDEVEWQADHTITGTKAEFNTALSDGNFVFEGDVPTLGKTIAIAQGAWR